MRNQIVENRDEMKFAHFNIEDIIDHSIVYILNTMEISWRSSASPQTSYFLKKEVKYTEIDDLAYH